MAEDLLKVFREAETPHVVLTMGKGGVGKTTFSILLGALLAGSGRKVLVASLDQAMHLEEYLGLSGRNRVERVDSNLYAMQVDIGREVRRLGQSYSTLLSQLMPGLKVINVESVVEMIKHAPGFEEEAYLRELARLYALKDFDYIVVDTPPTGLTFRILSLPSLYSFWLDRLLELRERIVSLRYVIARTAGIEREMDDPVLRKLEEQKTLFDELLERMKSQAKTTGAIVATPEPLPVYEALKTLEFLGRMGLPAKIIVANRVLPESLASMMGVSEVQEENLKKLLSAKCPGRCVKLLIPQSPKTPHSLEAVKDLIGSLKIVVEGV
ncbi:MAG: ArsA family ATPase [Desulfurococcales archaeon]|nr:ArsA family ATPase [Desulfurococcales archaeon]